MRVNLGPDCSPSGALPERGVFSRLFLSRRMLGISRKPGLAPRERVLPVAGFLYCQLHFGGLRVPGAGRGRCPSSVVESLPCAGAGTTLSGGSLGSCVDEERSQLR